MVVPIKPDYNSPPMRMWLNTLEDDERRLRAQASSWLSTIGNDRKLQPGREPKAIRVLLGYCRARDGM